MTEIANIREVTNRRELENAVQVPNNNNNNNNIFLLQTRGPYHRQGRRKPFQRPRQDPFSSPPHRLWRQPAQSTVARSV